MPIAYVAQTRDHLLMLDEEGVCLHVHRRSPERGDDAADGANHCLGAQYVAALNPAEPGFLGKSPTVGVPLLFAKVGPTGKISVVRTGLLERFEVRGSGMHPTARAQAQARGADPMADTGPTMIRYLPEDDAVEEEPTRIAPEMHEIAQAPLARGASAATS